MSVNQTNMTTYDHCHDDPSVFMYKSTVLTKGSNNNINNSLLDKAQQITMRNPCSHTWQYYTNIAFVRRRYRSIYNLYRLLTKAISVILLIWLVDQDYFTKWIQRALNVYFFPQIHIACTCEHPWWHHIDHLTFFSFIFLGYLKKLLFVQKIKYTMGLSLTVSITRQC